MLLCRGLELDIHLRHPKYLFQQGQTLELVCSDDDEFHTLIKAVKDIRILPQRINLMITMMRNKFSSKFNFIDLKITLGLKL